MVIRLNEYGKLLLIGIVLITATYFAANYFGSRQYKADNSKYILETSVRFVDKPIYITKIKAKIDTVYEPTFINGDTVYVPYTVAKADTVIQKDSSSVKITYYYPPKNYFDINLNIKEKIITNEILKVQPYEPKFWDRFNIVVYCGAGYDFIERRPSLSVGVGIGFSIKKLFGE